MKANTWIYKLYAYFLGHILGVIFPASYQRDNYEQNFHFLSDAEARLFQNNHVDMYIRAQFIRVLFSHGNNSIYTAITCALNW